ncbi:hypothetical protein [Candidatus Leptofilum sp.]|uniref:hypothetical protein n=1 Tax=Candidatus Leptofilum sp. TaxID=3241576 RepID=UPI003B5A7FB9
MNNATAVSATMPITNINHIPMGRLLVNDADEIIYANTQARHFLGLLAEESLQAELKLMPLLRESYHFYPTKAWLGWPKRPSTATSRYLIYTSPHRIHHAMLKVDIVEKIWLGNKNIWVITMQFVDPFKTAVKYPIA